MNPPAPVVLQEDSTAELRHVGTVGKNKELYRLVWPSGDMPVPLHSSDDPQLVADARGARLVERYRPGKERSQRNEIEPLRLPDTLPIADNDKTQRRAKQKSGVVSLNATAQIARDDHANRT